MITLQIIFALSVTVGYVTMGVPPPPPTPTPIPTEDPGCQVDMTCESTYQAEVVGNNPCQAAQTFKTCADGVQSLCTTPIPSTIQALVSGAEAAVAEKCNQVPDILPACANICLPYEDRAIADWADSKSKDGCEQYLLYRTCLQNFEDSSSANCKVTTFLAAAIIRHNTNCQRTCTDIYDECTTYLPILAADNSKLQEACLLWPVCKAYDFTSCQKTLTLNYDTLCANVEPLGGNGTREANTKSEEPSGENGVERIASSLVLVVTMFGVLFL